MAKKEVEQEMETSGSNVVQFEGKAKTVEGIDVAMTDGRVVTFTGKRRAVKEVMINGETIQIRLDFRNGETRLFTVPQNLVLQFAAHGASQKLGDVYAGLETDDAVQALDELIDQLYEGKWAAERAASTGPKPGAGGSSLVKALMEISGKTKEEITSFLSSKTPAEKDAIKLSSKVAPVYQRFESERLSKSGKAVDADAALAEMGI